MGNKGFLKILGAVLATSVLAACGGGGAQYGSGGTGDNGGGTPTQVPKTLVLLLSSPQLSSDASVPAKGVTLTAVVKDANQNVIQGVPVTFSTTDSAEIIASNPATTDATGRVAAVITTGGDQTNRTITVHAQAGTLPQVNAAISVVGTSLSISGPASTQFNVPTVYTILLTDAGQKGISGKTITLATNASNTLSAPSVVTDSSGSASVTLTPTQASSYLQAHSSLVQPDVTKQITVSIDEFTITAPAANASIGIGAIQPVTVQWKRNGINVADGTPVSFSATRGTLSASSATTSGGFATVNISSTESGPVTLVASSDQFTQPSVTLNFEFLSGAPEKIDVQASPANISVSQTSEITAVVRDQNNNLAKNAIVDFSLTDQTGGSLTTPSSVTNSQGVAKTTYNATTQGSGGTNQGVSVTGTVRNYLHQVDDPSTVANEIGTPIAGTAALTVGGQALNITIGTGTEIIKLNESTYQLPFSVLVTDAAHNPAQNAQFTLALVPVSFRKGPRDPGTGGVPGPACPNEDVNLNGIKDPSEDADGDGILEPGGVGSVPSTVALGATTGAGQFLLTYPKDRGNIVTVRVIGTASVAGSEATEVREILLPIAEGDAPHLPPENPYGDQVVGGDGTAATACFVH